MNGSARRRIATGLVLLAAILTVAALSACGDPTAAENRLCHWRYTAYRVVVTVDSVGNTTTSRMVPSDSVRECRTHDTYGARTAPAPSNSTSA